MAKLITGHADALLVAALSTAFAGLAAAAVLAWRGELGLLGARRLAPRLLAIGALGTAAANLCFYFGAGQYEAIARLDLTRATAHRRPVDPAARPRRQLRAGRRGRDAAPVARSRPDRGRHPGVRDRAGGGAGAPVSR